MRTHPPRRSRRRPPVTNDSETDVRQSPESGQSATPATEFADVSLPEAGLAGLLAGAITIGLAELIGVVWQRIGLEHGVASPVIAVGGAFVNHTPPWLKDFAVAHFGSQDKHVLLSGIGFALVLLSIAAGVIARWRLRWGLALVGLLGFVAVAAVLTRPNAWPLDAGPTLIGLAVGLACLRRLLTVRRATADGSRTAHLPALGAGHRRGGRRVGRRLAALHRGQGRRGQPRFDQAAGAGRAARGDPRRREPADPRDHAVPHEQLAVLPGRYGAEPAAAAGRQVAAEGPRPGRPRALDELRRPAGQAARRAGDHPHLCLQRGRRRPARQRGLAGLPDEGPAEPGRAEQRRRHGALHERRRDDHLARRSPS